MSSQYSATTTNWLSNASLEARKKLGQYMTPQALREQLLNQVELFPGIRVLDPSCGTGEFLRSILDRQPDAIVTGWDVDENILFAPTLANLLT